MELCGSERCASSICSKRCFRSRSRRNTRLSNDWKLCGRQPPPLHVGAGNPFRPVNPGHALAEIYDDTSRGLHIEAGQFIDHVAPAEKLFVASREVRRV